MKRLFLFLLLTIFALSCTPKKDDTNQNLAILLALASRGNTGLLASCTDSTFPGTACVPTSLTSNSVNTTTGRVVTAGNTLYNNLTSVYQPVRSNLNLNRSVLTNISQLITALRAIPSSSIPAQGTSTWGTPAQPTKFRYSASAQRSGGRRLEVWFNNAPAPYGNLKAFEMNYTDGGDNGIIQGQVWARTLNSNNTLGLAYVEFNYNGSNRTRSNALVVDGYFDSNTNVNERAHIFVNEGNGAARIDGGFTVTNAPTTTAGLSNLGQRVYVYNAIANDTRALVNVAFPLASSTSTSVFGNQDVANIAEVWTGWILFSLQFQGSLSSIVNSGATGCSVITAPSVAHPTTRQGATSAQFKTCLDAIRVSLPTAGNDVYFVTGAQNPAFYSFTPTAAGGTGNAILQATEAPPTGDTSWDSLRSLISTTLRNGQGADGYTANFTAAGIAGLSILSGANLQPNQQWGNGASGTNSLNGSANDTAPF